MILSGARSSTALFCEALGAIVCWLRRIRNMESTTFDLYEKSIRTKKVPLSAYDTFLLWANPSIFLLFPLWIFYRFGFEINFAVILLWAAGTYNVYTNFRDTTFVFLASKTPIVSKEQVILNLQRKYDWNLLDKSQQYIRFEDKVTWTKWPNYITLVWNEEGYFINCIDERFKTVTLFTNPWKRFEEVVAHIKELDPISQTTAPNTQNNAAQVKSHQRKDQGI
jgi:hypothetical protein